MAKKEWNSLKGLRWKMGVGVTMTEALNAEDATKLFVTTDHKVVMNGEVMDNVVGTISYMAFYADGETSNDDLIDALTLKLRNGASVGNANGVANVLNLCVEHGLVLKDQDFGMLVGVSSYEDMGLMYYSLTGMGIGQMEKGPGPSLFNLTLAYDKDNATLEVKGHMANVDVSLLKKLSYKEKTIPTYAPCVHKAIPTCPKAGRRYFSSNGTFHVNLELSKLEKAGENFIWDEKKLGAIQSVRDMDGYTTIYTKNLSKYEIVNEVTFKTLFRVSDFIGKAQYEFKLGDGGPMILTIDSDEKMFGSKDFSFHVDKISYGELRETASPYFVIRRGKVVFVKPAILSFSDDTNGDGMSIRYASNLCRNFRGFYKKYPKGYRTFTDKVKIANKKFGKRWKEVCTKNKSEKCLIDTALGNYVLNYLPLNNQSRKFRLYPCMYNGHRRKYKSIYYLEVYKDITEKLEKKVRLI